MNLHPRVLAVAGLLCLACFAAWPVGADPDQKPQNQVGQDGVDAFEPNNTLDKATEVEPGKEVRATLFPRGDRDFFRFKLDTAARVTVRLANTVPVLNLRVNLRNAQGRYLANATGGPGRSLVLAADLRASSYILEVDDDAHYEFERGHGSDSGESKTPYRLIVEAQPAIDPHEPNDDRAKPADLLLGQMQTFCIFPAGDVDYFRVRLPAAARGQLRVHATHVPENIALGVWVYDPDGRSHGLRGRPGRPVLVNVPINKAGDCLILLQDDYFQEGKFYKGTHSDASRQPIQLRADFMDAGDPFEPNDDFAQAAPLPLGKPVQASLFHVGDQDYFKLTLPPGPRGLLRVDLTGLSDAIHPLIWLYNSDRRHLQTQQGSRGRPLTMQSFLSPGDYYLVVSKGGFHNGREWDNSHYLECRERYTLKAEFVVEPTQEREPNDTLAQAEDLALGEGRTASLLPEPDVDTFRFTLKETDPGAVQIVVTGLNNRVFTYVYVRNAAGQRITATRVHREGMHVVNLSLEPGVYFVQLFPAEGNNGAYVEHAGTQFQGRPYQIAVLPQYRPTQVVDAGAYHLGDDKVQYFKKPDPDGPVFTKIIELRDPAEHDCLAIAAGSLPPNVPAERCATLSINGKVVALLNPLVSRSDTAMLPMVVDLPPGALRAGRNEITLRAGAPMGGRLDDFEFRGVTLGRRLVYRDTEKGPAAVVRADLKVRQDQPESADPARAAPLAFGTWHEFKLDGADTARCFTVDLAAPSHLRILLPGPHVEAAPAAALYRLHGSFAQGRPRILYLGSRTGRTQLDTQFPEIVFTRVEPTAKEAANILLDFPKLETFDAIILDGLTSLTQYDVASEKAQTHLRRFAESGKRVLILDPQCSLEKIGIKNVGWHQEGNDRTMDVPSADPRFAGDRGRSLGWPGPSNANRIENWKEAGFTLLAWDATDPAKAAVTAYRPLGKGLLIVETMQLGRPQNFPHARRRLQWLLGLENQLEWVVEAAPLLPGQRESALLGVSPLLSPGKYLFRLSSTGSQQAASAPFRIRVEQMPTEVTTGAAGGDPLTAHRLDLTNKPIELTGRIDHVNREFWYRLRTTAQRGATVRVECPEELDIAVDLYRGQPKPSGKKVLYLRGPYPNHNLHLWMPDIEWEHRELNAPRANQILLDAAALAKYHAIIVDAINDERSYGLNDKSVLAAIEQYAQAGGRFIILSPVCPLSGFGVKSEAAGRGFSSKSLYIGEPHELLAGYEGPRGSLDIARQYEDEIGAFSGWAAAGYAPLFRHADNPAAWATAVARKTGKGWIILDAQRIGGEDARPHGDWKLHLYLGAAPSLVHVRTVDNTYNRSFGSPEYFDLPAEDAEWVFRVADRLKCHRSAEPFTLRVEPVFIPSPEEPNDSPSQATALPFGKTVQGRLFPSGDRDVYRLNIETVGVVRFNLDHPADNIDIEATLRGSDLPLKKVLYLNGGRRDYDLPDRRLANVQFTTVDPLDAAPVWSTLGSYDAVILDGLTHAAHYGIDQPRIQELILKYVEAGGTFVLLCPQIPAEQAKVARFWGAQLVPGWRNNNVEVVDAAHPLHQRRALGTFSWSMSESHGYFTGWQEGGFHLVYADNSDKAKHALVAVKKTGKGMLVLDALEIGHPANGPTSVWHLANLIDAPLETFLDSHPEPRRGVPRFDERILLPGTYYLTVSDNARLGNYANASPLPYTLRLDFQALPDLTVEPAKLKPAAPGAEVRPPTNNKPETAADLLSGQPASVLIWPAGQTAWHRIAVPSPGKLVLDLTEVPEGLDPVVEIYRGADLVKPWRQFNDTTGRGYGKPEHAELEFAGSETLYIRVFDREGIRSSLSAMRLQVEFTAVPSPYEPNDDDKTASVLVPGHIYHVNLFPARDTDWYRFEVKEKTLLHVQVGRVPADLAVRLEVVSVENPKVVVHSAEGGRGAAVELKQTLAKPGAYFLILRAGGDGAPAPELFTLKADFQPAAPLPPVRLAGQWPAPDVAAAAPHSPIVLSFTKPIRAEGIDKAVAVVGDKSGNVAGKAELDATTNLLTFRPSAGFQVGEKVTVTVAGLRDSDNQELAGKVEWAFAVGNPRIAETVLRVALGRRKLGAGKHAVVVAPTNPLKAAPDVSVRLADGNTLAVEGLAQRADGAWQGTLTLAAAAANGPARFELSGTDALGRNVTRFQGDLTIEIDTEAPPAMPPPLLEQRPAGKILLTWSRPRDVADLAGYRIYRAAKDAAPLEERALAAEITTPNTTVFEDLPPTDGDWFYSIAPVDDAGNVGPLSPVSHGTADRLGPKLAVLDFTGRVEKGRVLLTWKRTDDADAIGYSLHRFTKKEDVDKIDPARPYRRLGLPEQATADTPADGEYFYVLASRDAAGNLSPLSPPLRLVVDTRPAHAALVFAAKSPLVAGDATFTVKLDEKLKAPLKLTAKLPNNQLRDLPLKALDELTYQGVLKLSKDDPDGPITFQAEGEDLHGNVGVVLTAGYRIDFDNAPPRIWVYTTPDRRHLSGVVRLAVHFGEPIVGEPSFAYTVGGKTFPLVLKKVRDQVYEGTMTLSADTPNGSAQFVITAEDRFGHKGGVFASGRDFVIDTMPPPPPTAVRVQALASNAVLVRWSPPIGESVSFFRLYAGPAADFKPDKTTLALDHIYNLEASYKPKEEKTLYLRLTAVDAAGNESLPSSAVRAEPDNTPPAAANDVAAAVQSDGQVRLTWRKDAITEEVRFLIFRTEQEAADLSRERPLAATQELAAFDRPPAAGAYFYHIVAEDLAGNRSPPIRSPRLAYDVTPPRAEVSLSPTFGVFPWWRDSGTLLQLPVIRAGKLQVRLRFDEPLAEPPTLRYRTKLFDTPKPVPLTAKGEEYHGEIEIAPAKEDGLLQFLVGARDRAGNAGTGFAAGERFWIDSMPPEPPAQVVVERRPLGKIAVAWSVPPGEQLHLLRFDVYRDRKPIAGVEGRKPIAQVDAQLAYLDSPADEGEHYYAVVAEDRGGNRSKPSESASTFSDTTPPLPPAQLTAVLAKEIRLSWQPSPEQGVHYRVYRAATAEVVSEKTRLADQLADTRLADLPQTDGTYYYAVTAVDASGNESRSSNTVRIEFVGRVPRAVVKTDPAGPVRGPFKITLTATLPLIEPPQLLLQIGSRSDAIALKKEGEDGTTWSGSFELRSEHPNGTARFSFRGAAKEGFVGTRIDTGEELTIDTHPPLARVDLSRASPLAAGTHEVTVHVSEPLASLPQLLLTTLGSAPRQVPLQKVNASVYQGTFTLTAEDRDGRAVFTFLGTDLAGNQGRLEGLSPFDVDHHPPKPPTTLSARSAAAGNVVLTWQAPLYAAHEPFDEIAGYNVYRSEKPIESLQGLTPIRRGVRSTEVTDRPPQDGTYHYAVATLDASGLLSPPTASVEAKSIRTPPAPPRITELKQLPTGMAIRWEHDHADAGLRYRVLVWTETDKEPREIARAFEGTSITYHPLVAGTYTVRVIATDLADNESGPSVPQSIAYRQLAPVASLTFSRPMPWSEGDVEMTLTLNRAPAAPPTLALAVGDKLLPVSLTGEGMQWRGKLVIAKSLPAERGEFRFKAVAREQDTDIEGTGIVQGRDATFDFTPPTLAIRFGPEVAVRDRLALLRAGANAFTVESSEPLAADPKLRFTPQGKATVAVALAAAGPRQWQGILLVDEKTGDGPGLFEMEATDRSGNTGKEIAVGRNVLVDTTPPGPVNKLRAVALPGGRVRLDWTPPILPSGEIDPAVLRFRVYRSDSRIVNLEGLAPVAELTRQLGWQDTPPADRLYHYTVIGIDEAGNVGAAAASVSAHVDKTPPGPPRELAVSETATGAVKLTWQPPTGEPAAYYRVYLEKAPIRSVRGLRPMSDVVPFTQIYGTPNENGQYWFAVTAVDHALNESEPSNVVFLDYKTIAPMAFFSIYRGDQAPDALGTLQITTAQPVSEPPQLLIKGPKGQPRRLPLVGNGRTWTARVVPHAWFPFTQTGSGAEAIYSLELSVTSPQTEPPQVVYQPEGAEPRPIIFGGRGQQFSAELTPRSFFRIDPKLWLNDGTYTVTLWTTGPLREPPKVQVHFEGGPPRPLGFTGSGDAWQARLIIDKTFAEGQYGFTIEAADAHGNVGTEIREGPLFRVDRTPPLRPEKPAAVADDKGLTGTVRVSWSPPQQAGADIPHTYRVYRSRQPFERTDQAELVRVYRVTHEGKNLEEIVDVPPKNGEWFYRIASQDLAGNESALSEVALAAVSSRTPQAEISVFTKQSGDAPALRVGKGEARVVLTTNVPLAKPPLLRWRLKSKPAESHLVPLAGEDTAFDGILKLDFPEDVEEDAEFDFLGVSTEGVEGRSIRSGREFIADTVGPEARIIIPSIYEMKIVAKPEGGGELQIPPVRAGRIRVNVELSEPAANVPALSYTLKGRPPVPVPLTGFGRMWHGWMDIPPGIPSAQGRFQFQAIDQAGNTSTKITRREYPREVDDTVFPPRTLRNFATTGGEFEVDSEPPSPPTNVVLAARKLGVAEIRWDAPTGGAWTYRLYRSLTPLVGRPPERPLKTEILARLMVDDPPVDGTYFYAVTAVDLAGNESPLSECPSIFIDTIKPELKVKAVVDGDDYVLLFPEEEPTVADITLRFPGQKEFKVSLGGESGQLKRVERIVDGKPIPAYVLPRQAQFFNGKVEVIVHSPDPEGNRVEAITETNYRTINSATGGQVESPDGQVKFAIPANVEPVVPLGPKEFKRVGGYDKLFFISYQRIPQKTPEAARTQDPRTPDPVPPGLEVVGTPYTIHLNEAPKEPIELRASATQADLSQLQTLKAKLTMKIPEYYSDQVKDKEYLKSRLKVIKWTPTPADGKRRGQWELVHDVEINTETGEVIAPADSITTYVIVSERTPPSVVDAKPEPNSSTRSPRPVISARIVDKGTGVATGAENPIVLTIDGQKAAASLVKLSSDDPTEVTLEYTPPTDLPPGVHLLSIRAEDVVGNVVNYQWRFTIDDRPPAVTAVTPADGSVIAVPRPIFSALLADEGGIDETKLRLEIDGVDTEPGLLRFDAGTGLFTFAPPADLSAGEHQARLVVHDRTGQATAREWKFVIDLEPPTVAPPTLEAGVLTVSLSDRWSRIDADRLRLVVANQAVPRAANEGEAGFRWQPVAGTVTYRLPEGVPSTQRQTVSVVAQDEWGNAIVRNWAVAEGQPAVDLDSGEVAPVIPLKPVIEVLPVRPREEKPPEVRPKTEAPPPAAEPRAPGRGWLWWLLGGLLLVAAGGGGYIWWKRMRVKRTAQTP